MKIASKIILGSPPYAKNRNPIKMMSGYQSSLMYQQSSKESELKFDEAFSSFGKPKYSSAFEMQAHSQRQGSLLDSDKHSAQMITASPSLVFQPQTAVTLDRNRTLTKMHDASQIIKDSPLPVRVGVNRTPTQHFVEALNSQNRALSLKIAKFGVRNDPYDISSTHGFEASTLLHLAARAGMKDVCQELISKGISVEAVDKFGTKPIHLAAKGGHKHTLQLFVQRERTSIAATMQATTRCIWRVSKATPTS